MNLTPSKTGAAFFIGCFFSAWKNDQEEDEKTMRNDVLLDHLPKNVMVEIKPFAEMQLKKLLKALEKSSPKQRDVLFGDLAEMCARNFWEKDLKEVKPNDMDNFTFCMSVFNEVVVENNSFGTFSRFLFEAASAAFDLHPDPQVEQVYM